MKYLAAFLLLTLTGEAPSAEKIKAILSAVGIDADEERLTTLLGEVEGKDVAELIAEGSAKLASVPSGGAAAAGGAAAGAAAGGAAEEAKEEAKEEEKEESDEDMGFGLFD
ncbi:60S acidic ribosomal protein P2 [Escovopsis weberi]|uniref:60S acidic ribosomal protein P2 n=1 Tax=Escovopsis weberi TaxID=150374 RepID=A0A0N0RTB3_ESCWE|nr:60S acidic ribosomal protein P2 [Escovopsis weberi]